MIVEPQLTTGLLLLRTVRCPAWPSSFLPRALSGRSVSCTLVLLLSSFNVPHLVWPYLMSFLELSEINRVEEEQCSTAELRTIKLHTSQAHTYTGTGMMLVRFSWQLCSVWIHAARHLLRGTL